MKRRCQYQQSQLLFLSETVAAQKKQLGQLENLVPNPQQEVFDATQAGIDYS